MPRPSKKGAQQAGGGRDPETGRFVRGYAGGPGRPEGSRNGASLVLERMLQDDGERVVRATMRPRSAATSRRSVSSSIVSPRPGRAPGCPLALPKVETAADVLAALGAVIQAMAEGKVSPEEGAVMTQVIAAPRQVFEAHEFERRLSMIEAQLARLGPQQRGNVA